MISRRSGGLSIGINLNPDAACNFDCVYCQVDRTVEPRTRKVDLDVLAQELAAMIDHAASGALFEEAAFANVPLALRRIRDIAFSGDGEPTACPVFLEAVLLAARERMRADLRDTRIVLITDACYLTRPNVVKALQIMDANNGQIWAKLDAGTEAYFRKVNKPNVSLRHVIDNITHAAQRRPLVIQALFMHLDGVGPDDSEIQAFADRLREILERGGAISLVQVYTVARRPAMPFVTPLSNQEVDRIAETMRRLTGLATESYYGPASI